MTPLKPCGFRLSSETIAILKTKNNQSEFVRQALTTAIAAESLQQKTA